ncbi:hypothetical protein SJA_C1-27920 [Sphingobium indicum UT26S]|uniref:Uncharacterized protein n=1 Tax=Sphingobium indicum (strain DSM 16413 / CCM 7287 / MTCC 6362 / UT26 / NBRC 101211 / UT26S) TaxID=452662 RepID=D4Z4U4_SPHIU|nr:hypothetical protein SJA_C1-27920 [Sphingobium indicum UT26S]
MKSFNLSPFGLSLSKPFAERSEATSPAAQRGPSTSLRANGHWNKEYQA